MPCRDNKDFPAAWKLAITVPVIKSGKPSDNPLSYRPISLLSMFGKIFELLILLKLKPEMDTP